MRLRVILRFSHQPLTKGRTYVEAQTLAVLQPGLTARAAVQAPRPQRRSIPQCADPPKPPTSVAAADIGRCGPLSQAAGLTHAASPPLRQAGPGPEWCKAASSPKPVPDFPATLPTDSDQGRPGAPASLYEYSDFQ